MGEPVRVTFTDTTLERRRLTVLFRLILAIPHLIVVFVLGGIAVILSPFLWLATLFTGRAPDALADYFRLVVRYTLHVYGYLYLATAPYPPWPGTRDDYPLDVHFPPAAPQSRWGVAFRLILAVPALVLVFTLFGSGGGSGTGSDDSASVAFQGAGAAVTVAIFGWFAALVTGRMPQGLRDFQVYALGFAAQAYSYLFLLSDRYPDPAPRSYPLTPMPEHPVTLSIAADELRRSRLTSFFRLLLAVPHLIWLTLWTIVAVLAAIAAWFAALAAGRTPAALHRFLAAYVRYSAHVTAFLYLTADPFPGFAGAAEGYPAAVTIGDPVRQNRWTVLGRVILAIPAAVLTSALSGVYLMIGIFSWWTAVLLGRVPRGLRDAGAFVLRYTAQASAYVLLLTPRYPYAGPGPGTRASVIADAPAAPPAPAITGLP